jgi:hypothetical protein
MVNPEQNKKRIIFRLYAMHLLGTSMAKEYPT